MNKHLTIERLREVLAYDPETGIFVWRISLNPMQKIGEVAGCICTSRGRAQCRVIKIDGGRYFAHHLAWYYVNGVVHKGHLHPKNGDALDLRIANWTEMPFKVPFGTKSPGGKRAYARAHYAADPELYRWGALKYRTGISLAEYQKMFVAQGGVCAICAKPNTSKNGKTNRWLVVDHDHTTGMVRGLLCDPCNRGLGFLKDDIGNLERAAEYLRSHAPVANVVAFPVKEN